MGRRRQGRIAHAEVDDIGARVPCGRLGLVDLLEHIRRQSADAVKIFHGPRAPATQAETRGRITVRRGSCTASPTFAWKSRQISKIARNSGLFLHHPWG